jgi:cytochrome o ubiquinol oxidase subunit 2
VARIERHEFLIVGTILFFVLAPIYILLPIIAWRYRIANIKSVFRPRWSFSWYLEGLIWLPPTGIVVLLSVLLIRYTTMLDPYHPRPIPRGPALEIDVVALDWKWLFLYPDQHVATVNSLIVPAGQPIHFVMTSGTVMQSMLMPRLAGQIFAMAGMRTQLQFEVSDPGAYYGENTQYNGDGFARDKFVIHAVSGADFTKWVTQIQKNRNVFDDMAYQKLSVKSVISAPPVFGSLEPDIFERIIAQKIVPGYMLKQSGEPHG